MSTSQMPRNRQLFTLCGPSGHLEVIYTVPMSICQRSKESIRTPVTGRRASVHLEVDAGATAEDVRAGHDGPTATEVRRLLSVDIEGGLVITAS